MAKRKPVDEVALAQAWCRHRKPLWTEQDWNDWVKTNPAIDHIIKAADKEQTHAIQIESPGRRHARSRSRP